MQEIKRIFLQPKKDLIFKILLTFIGGMFLGFGIAFNNCSDLGNDPISVLYDGFSKSFNIPLGNAANIANLVMFIVMLIFARKFFNIGTLIYVLPLGSFVSWGINLHTFIGLPYTLFGQIISGTMGCLMLFFGIAIFVAINIGVDPWSAVALKFAEVTPWPYKFYKVTIDVICFLVGWFLGGTVGILTVIAALAGGPTIQIIVNFLTKSVFKLFKFKEI